jgi:DNA mismatch endonuclease (patch repair protein)
MDGEANLKNTARAPHSPKTDAATSQRLSRIRQHGTEPELVVRRVLTKMGVRYRTKNRDLPGSPDLANRRRRWAIFVHGCYWHHHESCRRATIPKNNRDFWIEKFMANRRRDEQAVLALQDRGFRVLVLWECQIAHGVHEKIVRHLSEDHSAR